MIRPVPLEGHGPVFRNAAASGSAIHNCYLTLTHPKGNAPPFVTGAPGLRQWADVPFLPQGALSTAVEGIHGLIEIDSPTYGHRLFGISSEYQLFEIRLGGTAPTDPAANYDPFRRNNPSSLHSVVRVQNFTVDQNKKAVGPVRLCTDGQRILWAIKRDVYMWDMAENGGDGGFFSILAPTPDNDTDTLPDEEWTDSAFIDGYFFLFARNGQIFHSLLDSPHFDQLDLAEANSKDDPTVGVGVHQRRLYVFGSRSIEQWYHAPRGTDFAFRRDLSFITDFGAASRDSIQSYENGVCFLGSDGIAYNFSRGGTLRLSNDDIERDIQDSLMDQARGFTYTEQGHRFYSLVLAYPDGTLKNWTIDLDNDLWATRSLTTLQSLGRFRYQNYVGMNGQSGIYSYRTAWGSEGAGAVTRSVSSRVMYATNTRYRVQTVQLIIRTPGNGTVQLAKSTDGGQSWTDVCPAKSLESGLVEWSAAFPADREDMERLLNEKRLNLRFTFTATHQIDVSNTFMRVEPVR